MVKRKNDYNLLFDDWSEADMRSLVRHYFYERLVCVDRIFVIRVIIRSVYKKAGKVVLTVKSKGMPTQRVTMCVE